MLSPVITKGQVMITKPTQDTMGIGPNDRVAFIRKGERVLLQTLRTLKVFRGGAKAALPESTPVPDPL
jgi:bifunctional DNA-binding transcriptional regulator/antitoxin component of YhaV-PrlF toxin-antitoxin module